MASNHHSATVEAEIRTIVEDWASAVRGRNIPAILRNHSSDILMFDVPPPFQSRGLDAYRKTWDLFFSWASNPAVFDIQHMQVTAGSEVAFVTASMKCAGQAPAGESVDLEFRLTMGLRKIDGQLVIVHENHSVPADH